MAATDQNTEQRMTTLKHAQQCTDVAVLGRCGGLLLLLHCTYCTDCCLTSLPIGVCVLQIKSMTRAWNVLWQKPQVLVPRV